MVSVRYLTKCISQCVFPTGIKPTVPAITSYSTSIFPAMVKINLTRVTKIPRNQSLHKTKVQVDTSSVKKSNLIDIHRSWIITSFEHICTYVHMVWFSSGLGMYWKSEFFLTRGSFDNKSTHYVYKC